MQKRTLAIGDVHGCHTALVTLLEVIKLNSADTVVFIGDLVDRGPSSKQVVDCVLSLRDVCNVIVLMGNHEEMMRNAISGQGLFTAWLDAGGDKTLESYGGSIEAIPSEHIRLLVSALPFYETESEIFVHASLEFDMSLPNQNSDYLRWKHISGSERRHISGKRVICGHTAQTDGVPLVFDGWVCIDTYPHGGKWLSCLDVAADHVYQASENCQTRDFKLSRYM
jgi:serine/threonine protein phosphatase 1